MRKIFTILSLISFVHLTMYAQDEPTEDIYDISLEELLDMEVVSSTKSSVKIQKAPSVIRVYTKKDFEKFNFITLQDVLMSIPGTQIQQYRAGHQLVWIRGVQARYNNKVLLLIDGVPMRDSYYGNFNIDEMIPLEMVERIEVINGPGSVLYGANSFSGVINITTKKEGKQVGVDYGSFNTFSAHAEYSINNFYGHFGYFQTDGFEPDLRSNGLPRDDSQAADNIYGYLKYQNENLQVNLGMMKYNYPYKYRSSDRKYDFERIPIFGRAKYNIKLSEHNNIHVSAYMNDYGFTRFKLKYDDDFSTTVKEISDNSLDTRILGSDIEYFHRLEKHSLIVGVSWQRDLATDMNEIITFDDGDFVNEYEEILLENDISRDNTGFYIQDTWTLSPNWSFTGGLRYDIQSKFENQFNYRAGFTGNLTDHIYTKILYGTAYRVPSYREYLDIDAPNRDLKPEELRTAEFQIGYLQDKFDINLTLYNNTYTDFISEINVESIIENGVAVEIDDEMAFNFNSRKITGLELNSVIRPTNKISANFGLSYILSAREEFGELESNIVPAEPVVSEEEDITFLSSANLYLLLNYQITPKYSVGLNTYYFGNRNVPQNYQDDVPVVNRDLDNSDGFATADFSFIAKPIDKLILNLKVNNIFDGEYYSPPFAGNVDYDTQWPGINFRIAAIYKL